MASIQKRGKNSWLLVVEAGYDAKGKRIRRTKTIRAKNKTEAQKKLAQFQVEVEAGEYISPAKMTIRQFIPEWEKKYAEKHLSESTLETYLSHIENHIIPALGHMRLDQVQPIHIINFLDDLKRKDGRGEELAVGTVQYIYRVLRNIFSRTVDWKIIKENPVATVKRPKDTKRQKEPNVYNEKEIAILFEAVQNEPIHWRIMTTLALTTGLRRGELLGLEWSHIDFEAGVMHIKQEVIRGKGGKPVVKPHTKWNKTRLVSLSKSVISELKEYRHYWRKEKMRVLDKWVEKKHEFVLCNIDGTHFYPTTPTTWWRRFTKRAGVRYIRLHDLRHTMATLMINQGVHAKIISARLGHADIRITMDTYGHALQTADHDAANKLDMVIYKKEKHI